MTDLFSPVEPAGVAPDEARLAALHARLVDAAHTAGDLDLAYRTIDSPVGPLLLVRTPTGVVRIAFGSEGEEAVLASLADAISPRVLRAPGQLDDLARELDEYFAGDRRRFDVPVDLRLARGFRREVLEQLPQIHYGRTASYTEVATVSGRPTAVRAAATACATNPIPLVIPCHRVVRADGTTGEYRGGAAAKEQLLALERAAH